MTSLYLKTAFKPEKTEKMLQSGQTLNSDVKKKYGILVIKF